MSRWATKLILVIYGLSIMSTSLLNTSHEVLHYFKNTIHHHAHHEHHHVKDHHSFLNKDVSPQDFNSQTSIIINIHFIFFEQSTSYGFELSDQIKFQLLHIVAKLHCGYVNPLLDPPLVQVATT